MKKALFYVLGIAVILAPAAMLAQSKPTGATYITDEEVKAVNATARHRSHDQGRRHRPRELCGRRHSSRRPGGRPWRRRGRRCRARTGAGAGAAGWRGCGRGPGAAPAAEPCGEQSTAPPTGGTPGSIAHDQQTEGYLIISGGGTLVTGGKIVNGRKSPPESAVTKVLNGPSCSGMMVGADVVKKVVKTGDIIIIPAGVPHGWTDITDHVDYLSFRPSARVLEAGYTHPALKK